jgi:hypothetical protein
VGKTSRVLFLYSCERVDHPRKGPLPFVDSVRHPPNARSKLRGMHQCEFCHGAVSSIRPGVRFCSQTCRWKSWAERNPEKAKQPSRAIQGMRSCRVCGQDFFSRRLDHVVCSQVCHNEEHKVTQKAARESKKQSKECDICGSSFLTNFPNVLRCSQRCMDLAAASRIRAKGGHKYRLKLVHWVPPKPRPRRYRKVTKGGPTCSLRPRSRKFPPPPTVRRFIQGRCEVCEDEFCALDLGDRFCSPQCRKAWGKKKRRYSSRKGQKVFERDEFICWLCNKPCEPDAKVPDLLAPTVDHVVPISSGGSDDYENLRCAHFVCNSKRGNANILPLIANV